jgi:uncharacterized protein YjiK
MTSKFRLLIICFTFIIIACNTNSADGKHVISDSTRTDTTKTIQSNSYNYDLSNPKKKWRLAPDLLEISGNTWVDNNHLLVIEDLHPNLYLLKLNADSATIEKKVPFMEETPGEKFDVEDVTIVNNTVYAIWSHGAILKVTNWQGKPEMKEIKTFLSKENNTEGICFDPVTNNLLVTCKNESDVEDEKKSTRAVYEFDLKSDSLKSEPFMLIHKKDLEKQAGEKLEFYPSAIAVHPVTHDIYILSTKETKCMAVFKHSGELISVEFIAKELLPQPEGICFAPDGTLYISTEGKQGHPGYLFQYDFKK